MYETNQTVQAMRFEVQSMKRFHDEFVARTNSELRRLESTVERYRLEMLDQNKKNAQALKDSQQFYELALSDCQIINESMAKHFEDDTFSLKAHISSVEAKGRVTAGVLSGVIPEYKELINKAEIRCNENAQNIWEEVSRRLACFDMLKNDCLQISNRMSLDAEALQKEIDYNKHETFMNKKNIENLYDLIERLKNR